MTDQQASIRMLAFGSAYTQDFIRISMANEPMEGAQVSALGPTLEPIDWTTSYMGEEMISSAPAGTFSTQQIADMDQINARAHLIVGTLAGPSGSVPVVGLYHTATDANGVEIHHIVPIAEASVELIALLDEITGILENAQVQKIQKNPCATANHCRLVYNDRLKQALEQFADCMSGAAPPISLCFVGCLVLCAPTLLGTPLAYAACITACGAGCSGITLLEISTCETALANRKLDLENAYCTCLEWKQANCDPADWEVNLLAGGCP